MGILTNLAGRIESAFGIKASNPAYTAPYESSAIRSYNDLSWAAAIAQGNGYNTQNQRSAMLSAWISSNANAIAQEFSTAELVVKKRMKRGDDVIIKNHEFERLWHSPSKFLGNTSMMQQIALQYVLWGKSFLFFAPDTGTMTLSEIWPIPPYQAWPIAGMPPDDFIVGYNYKPNADEKPIGIHSEYMAYSRLPSPFDMRDGLPPIMAALKAVMQDNRYVQWNLDFFGPQNGMPTAIVSLPKELGDDQYARAKRELSDLYGNGQRRIAVTRSGQVEIDVISQKIADMEFHTGREFLKAEIDRAMGVPEGFWDMKANRANSDHANGVFIRNCVWPKLSILQEDINSQIIHH